MSGDNLGFKGNRRSNERKNDGGGPRPDHNKVKRLAAEKRLEDWQGLSLDTQLAEIDRRFGKGLGAKKQRARIAAAIAAAKAKPVKHDEPMANKGDEGTRIKAKERRAAEQAKRPSK